MRYRAFAGTDRGRRRLHNEDAFLVDPELQLYALADGMGGHRAGEVASRLFTEAVRDEVARLAQHLSRHRGRPEERRRTILRALPAAVHEANSAIYFESRRDRRKRGMGTTGIVFLPADNDAFVCHVGDSRLYLFRSDRLYQITEDHSLVRHLVKQGKLSPDEAENHPKKNVVVRCIGLQPDVVVDTLYLETFPGDVFILCSDGLSDLVTNDELARLVRSYQGQQLVDEAIALANYRGGHDNVTVIALHLEADETPPHQRPATTTSARVSHVEKARLMRRMGLFAELTEQELVKVNRILYQKRARQGTIIMREGDPGDALYIIAKGRVSVWKQTTHLVDLGRGRHFGELGLVGDQRRTATLRAEVETLLLTISRADLLELIQQDAELGNKILWGFVRGLAERVRDLSSRALIIHQPTEAWLCTSIPIPRECSFASCAP